MPLRLLLLLVSACCFHATGAVARLEAQALPDSLRDFGALITRLSERGGFFDTDNLISNESSYLHVVGVLHRLDVTGGGYVGVGPDQNFSYIAHIRPRIAFLLDIRRDNLLQHLMFKALFARADSRAAYLELLLGRPRLPQRLHRPDAGLPAILSALDARAPTDASRAAALTAVRTTVTQFGVALTDDDLATVERFHRAFIDGGLALRFTSMGRAPRPYYPTFRDLLLERDADGRMAGYLARETDFQFLKAMQRRNLLVPVVGDLGGTHAVRAIADYMRQHDLPLSALYVSNAEDYLLRAGTFQVYAQSVATFPRTTNSIVIRSWFGGPRSHAVSIGDYYTTQLVQRVEDLVDVAPSVRFYRELVQQRYLPLR